MLSAMSNPNITFNLDKRDVSSKHSIQPKMKIYQYLTLMSVSGRLFISYTSIYIYTQDVDWTQESGQKCQVCGWPTYNLAICSNYIPACLG